MRRVGARKGGADDAESRGATGAGEGPVGGGCANALVGGPVVDTPEVAGAKAAFFAAYDAAAAQGHRRRRSAPILAAAPLAAAAPAREAVLTTIKLNPGHAIFYRVD